VFTYNLSVCPCWWWGCWHAGERRRADAAEAARDEALRRLEGQGGEAVVLRGECRRLEVEVKQLLVVADEVEGLRGERGARREADAMVRALAKRLEDLQGDMRQEQEQEASSRARAVAVREARLEAEVQRLRRAHAAALEAGRALEVEVRRAVGEARASRARAEEATTRIQGV
jgi:hypothetical protein